MLSGARRPLLPMLVEGQSFIDAQDELSVLEFMRKYGMPDRINEEVFISMAKALDFIDPDKLSMTVVLTAMNRFLNEDDGLQVRAVTVPQMRSSHRVRSRTHLWRIASAMLVPRWRSSMATSPTACARR